MTSRKLVAELLGTACLVFFGAGTATLTFGFKMTGSATAAGVITTAFAFGMILLALAYSLGPISGCHINPAVTIGFLLTRRITLREATSYWACQVIGGIGGSVLLWAVLSGATGYSTDQQGLGADGFGSRSMVGLGAGSAFLTELVLTFLFVFVVLAVTRKAAWPQLGGVAIGLALVAVHLIGIPLTGTSVNPARSIGPALLVGGTALSQLWLFVIAPMIGGAAAAIASRYFFPEELPAPEVVAAEPLGSAAARGAGSPA